MILSEYFSLLKFLAKFYSKTTSAQTADRKILHFQTHTVFLHRHVDPLTIVSFAYNQHVNQVLREVLCLYILCHDHGMSSQPQI